MNREQALNLTPYHWDIFWETLSQWPGWQEILAEFQTKPFGLELIPELFWLLYSGTIEVPAMHQVPAAARLNILVINRLLQSHEFQQLREVTRGGRQKSLFAAFQILALIVKVLPPELINVALKVKSVSFSVNRLKTQADFLGKGRYGTNRELPPSPLYYQAYMRTVRELEKALRVQRSLLAELMRLWFSGSASRLGQEFQQGFQAPAAYDLGHGEKGKYHHSNDLRGYLVYIARYSGNQKLKNIANRAQTLKWSGAIPCTAEGEGVLQGICTGDLTEFLLTEQWRDFFHPSRKKRFYARLIEQQLWMLDFSGRRQRGPLVICVDCSGSMQGPKEEKAKAIAINVLEQARLSRRDCTVLLFGDQKTIERVHCPKGCYSDNDIINILLTFFNTRTTDFSRPLEEVMKIAANYAQDQLDMLFISDGLGRVNTETLEKFGHLQKSGRLFAWAIIVDGTEKEGEVVRGFAQDIFFSRELLEAEV